MKAVAPHVGAWIETLGLALNLVDAGVAPHVGAWIETVQVLPKQHSRGSPLT